MRGEEVTMLMFMGIAIGGVAVTLVRKFLLPELSQKPAPRIEEGHKALLERVQNVLGLVSQVDANPDNAQYKDQLIKQVREFKTDLEGNGLTVVTEPDENHKGFLQVVNGQVGNGREIARPLILRGENVVLSGIELVANQG